MQNLALKIGGTPILKPTDVNLPEHLYNHPLDLGSSIISNALTIFITAGIIVALITVIWAGIQWTTSDGDKQKVAAARACLTWGIIGLIIILISFFIINIVSHLFGVNLLNVSFN
jgi:hypothetical protein